MKKLEKKIKKPQGILTNVDIKKLKGVFTTAEDHVHLEDKVDKITESQLGVEKRVGKLEVKLDNVTELVEKLPTRDEMERMLDRTFGLTKLKDEHDRMKKIFREKFHINVEVEVL